MRRKWIWVFCVLVCFLGIMPAAAQEATPEVKSLTLTEHYAAPDGQLEFRYPEGWITHTRDLTTALVGRVRLENVASVTGKEIYTPNGVFLPGEIAIDIVAYDFTEILDTLPNSAFNLTPDMGAAEWLQASIDTYPPGSYFEFGKVIETTIGTHSAGMARIQVGDEAEGMTIIVDYGQHQFLTIQVSTAPGELGLWILTVFDIAQSLRLTHAFEITPEVLDLTETYTTGNGLTAFHYPLVWLLRDVHGTDADVANTQEAMDYGFGDTFQSGTVRINVTAQTFTVKDNPLSLIQSIYDASGDAVRSEFDPPQAIEIDDRRAALMVIPSELFDILYVFIEIRPGVIGVVQVSAAPGELERWRYTAYAIAETITYSG